MSNCLEGFPYIRVLFFTKYIFLVFYCVRAVTKLKSKCSIIYLNIFDSFPILINMMFYFIGKKVRFNCIFKIIDRFLKTFTQGNKNPYSISFKINIKYTPMCRSKNIPNPFSFTF